MPTRWISRLFKQSAVSEPLSTVNSLQDQQVEAEPPQTLPARESSLNLECSFFSVMLEVSEDTFKSLSKEQKLQTREIQETLLQKYLNIDNLPRRPSSLPLLISLIKNEDLPYSEITDALLKDPALTSKVLKTANSPYFRASSKPVDTLEQAILLLGVGGIKKVIAATVMKPVFQARSTDDKHFYEKVWHWAMLTGCANDRYGQELGEREGALYLLGLLPALCFLSVHQALIDYEKEHAEEHGIAAEQEKLIVKSISASFCKTIREQWGLPEFYDQYILELARPPGNTEGAPTILRDSIVLSAYSYLKGLDKSPFDESQLASITSTNSGLNNVVANFMDRSNTN